MLLCLILSTSAMPNTAGWRGIVPLRSSRRDVERNIGPPVSPGDNIYNLKDERVRVEYSVLPCRAGWPYGWNVPAETVTLIQVFPKKKPMLSELGADLIKYDKFNAPGAPGDVHYNNFDEGLSIFYWSRLQDPMS